MRFPAYPEQLALGSTRQTVRNRRLELKETFSMLFPYDPLPNKEAVASIHGGLRFGLCFPPPAPRLEEEIEARLRRPLADQY